MTRTRRTRTKTESQPPLFALALGGNLGDPEARFRIALGHLEVQLGPLDIAPLYSGPADSPFPQPDYLNTVATGHSRLPPDGILALGHWLEQRAGRSRGRRGEARPLDIDLLLYGDLVSDHPELTLPHPRLRQRRFVLAPLADLHPHLALPPDGVTVEKALLSAPPAPGLEKVRGGRRWY